MNLFEVLNSRYESMRPAVITSQYPMRELMERLSRKGESDTARAIASRLAETYADVWLVGGDRRLPRVLSHPEKIGRIYDSIP
jgi:DNA replication protein DnaC